MAREVKIRASSISVLFLFFLLSHLLSTQAFSQSSFIELLFTRNDSVRGGFTELLLQPINHSADKVYIEHFPGMQAIHIFVVSAEGVVHRPSRVSSPKRLEFYSKKRFCLFPSSKSGFIFSVEKGNSFGIEKPGVYYIAYAIRRPGQEMGLIFSPLAEFTLDEKHEISGCSPISVERLSLGVRKVFCTEIQNTMSQEGLPVLSSDIPF